MCYNIETIYKELKRLKDDNAFQKNVENVKCGRFVRSTEVYDYRSRLIYTNQLRNYIYNPGLLNVIFTDIELKTLFFRTFGYRGSMSFTIYPNAWLRDFPLLDIGENAYLGDHILLGTNQVSMDQKFVSVGKIKIGANTVINQRGAIGYNCTIGNRCSIGFDVAIGIKGSVGNSTFIGDKTSIGHGVKIGDDVIIKQASIIGNKCIIEDGVKLDFATIIPPYSHVSLASIINYRG